MMRTVIVSLDDFSLEKMTILKRFFFLIVVGEFILKVASVGFNPKFTYTPRFRKVTLIPNCTGHNVIDQYRDQQLVNGDMTINSNETIDQIIIVIRRCNPEGFDCEYFQTWRLEDYCNQLKDKNQVWGRWMGAYHPPLTCPMNNVHYQLRNATIDVEKAVRWYPDALNYHWRVITKYYAGDTLVGGINVELYIFGYRKRDSKPSVLFNVIPTQKSQPV